MSFRLGPLGPMEFGAHCAHCGAIAVVNGEELHKSTCSEIPSPLDRLRLQLLKHGFADHDFTEGGLFDGMSATDLSEVLIKVKADDQKIMR